MPSDLDLRFAEEAELFRRQDLYRDYQDADDVLQVKRNTEEHMKYAYGPDSPSGDIYGELARAVRATEMQREERDRRKKALQTYDDTLRARQRLQLPIIFDRLGLVRYDDGDRLGLVRYDDGLMSEISDADLFHLLEQSPIAVETQTFHWMRHSRLHLEAHLHLAGTNPFGMRKNT